MFGFKRKERKESKESNEEIISKQLESAELEETDDRLSKGLSKLLSLFIGTDRDIVDVIPYKRITEDGFLEDKDGHYQSYLKVKTYDLQSMNDNDLDMLTQAFQNILKVYTEPMKILSMTYPTETRDQQNFQRAKINQYNQRLQNEQLTARQREGIENKRFRAMEELQRMEWAETTLKDLTFFIVVYGKTHEEVIESVRSMQRLGRRYFSLEQVKSRKVLENIIKQLNNMNQDV